MHQVLPTKNIIQKARRWPDHVEGCVCIFERSKKSSEFNFFVCSRGTSGRIGHYILGKTIGSGGFARVKEAKHDLTGVRVAVKIINKAKMKNKNMISKVKREVRILKIINHPNIIKLYEVLDTTTDIFVVMELADKGQLYEYIQTHDLTEEQAKKFFSQIIEGVEAAHLNLVAHRDLKPENILLDSSYNVKIADFGLSNLMKDGKMLKTSCGSLNYAAPQILGHRKYEGTSVDVWSCGIILYTLLVGALPFDEEVVSVLYKKIQKGDFKIPHTVGPLAEDLLRRMIQPCPTRRLRMSQIRMHPWLRPTIPLYARLATWNVTAIQRTDSIDRSVLQQVKTFKMESLKSKEDDVERVQRYLKGRLDASFVTAYELLKDQRQSEGTCESSLQEKPEPNLIMKSVPNKLLKDILQKKSQNVFGYTFQNGARVTVEILLQLLGKMKIDFVIKNNQYCILCSTGNNTSQFSRNRAKKVKFMVQLYHKGKTQTMMDIRLAQGHPLVFVRLCHQIYKQLSELLKYKE